MASQEDEALRFMRAALDNPHGTALERRHRLLAAWMFLRRSAVPHPVVDGTTMLLVSWLFCSSMVCFGTSDCP
jgi:hypothetical protein